MNMTKTNNKTPTVTTTKERKYKCTICTKKFLSSSDLRKHVRIHTDERPYICNECQLAFRQAVTLKNHIISKHCKLNGFFRCEICYQSFALKGRLKLHLRTHTGEKPYACEHCPKTFARRGQMQQHLRVHDRKKPFSCDVCGASYTCSQNLRLHKNKHYNVKQYTCEWCGKSFTRRDALVKHLRNIHENIKAFRCPICHKDFKGHLPQHLRTHTKTKPHVCAHCKLAFAQRSQLIVHQRIHSGERPYRCRVCWKAFAHSTALHLHKRQHTGEKPFVCMECKLEFNQISHLKKHMLYKHNMDKAFHCQWCKEYFKSKKELQEHVQFCDKKPLKLESSDDDIQPMRLTKMRFLLAVLLKRISTDERLSELGFDKKLIDEVLELSIAYAGRKPCVDKTLSKAERLKNNIKILLEWTVPDEYMKKYKIQQRSVEELLEDLTS